MVQTRIRKGWSSLRTEGKVFLIIIALAIIAVTSCLIFAPPIRPAVAGIDQNDFGLGFRVGDPWNPDAFEAAMKQRGLNMRRIIHPDEAEREKRQEESGRHLTAFWTPTNSLMVMAVSDDRSANAAVASIGINPRIAPDEQQSFAELSGSLESKYSYSELAAWLHSGLPMSKEAQKDYEKITLPGNLHFGDASKSIILALGLPDEQRPELADSFFYYGHNTSIAFIPANVVEGVVIKPRPKSITPKVRLRMWWLYVTAILPGQKATHVSSATEGGAA